MVGASQYEDLAEKQLINESMKKSMNKNNNFIMQEPSQG